MKILQIIGNLKYGGAERVVVNNHLMFKKFGIESKIVTLKNDNFYKIDDDLIYLNISKKWALKKLLKMIEKEKPDKVLLHMHDMGRIFKNYFDDKFLFVVHSDWYERLKKESFFKKFKVIRDFKKIYNNKNIITVSKGIKQNFLKFGFNINSITTIYNPFDEDYITNASNEFVVKENDYIIHVASLRKVKRQDILLRAYALSKIKEKLLIIGEGKEKENLIKLSYDLGINDKVEFLGLKQNPYPYIKKAKLLVLSSEAEGLGNVLIESLILKTPVVSTNCNSGPREILTNELAKYLVKVNDVKDLSNKIKLALNEDPNIQKKHYKKFLDKEIIKQYVQ